MTRHARWAAAALFLVAALAGCRSRGDSLLRFMLGAGDRDLLAVRRVVVVGAPRATPGEGAAIASWVQAQPNHEASSLAAASALAAGLRTEGFRALLVLDENREKARPVEVVAVVPWSEAATAADVASAARADAIVSVIAGREDTASGATVELRRAAWISIARPSGFENRRTDTATRTITFPDPKAAEGLSADDREKLRTMFKELFDRFRGLAQVESVTRPLEEALNALLGEGGLKPEDRERIVAALLIDLAQPAARNAVR